MAPPVKNAEKQPSPPPLPGAATRSRRSAAEPDRITRFASPNRFDSLDTPVSFLDRRPTATSPSVVPSSSATFCSGGGGEGAGGGAAAAGGDRGLPWRSSVRSNLDSITRRALPERCISHDWLITPLTGQAYQTSHSAMLTPSRTSTSQSLPVRRKANDRRSDCPAGGPPMDGSLMAMPRTASTVGTGALTGERPEQGHQRLSQLTASVQRLLAEREEERKKMSRRQFELQIGAGGGTKSEDGLEEEEISPRRALHVSAQRPTHWETPGKFEPERISQELVNDFFSSPLTESPEYGDMVTVASIARQKEEQERAKTARSHSSHSLADGGVGEPRVVTRTTIRSDATTSKRLTAPSEDGLEGPEEQKGSPSSPETDKNGSGGDGDDDYKRQLDELAGRMGLIERRPSTVERTARKAVPSIADDSYRQSTAVRHMSEPDQVYEDSKKIHRRTRSAGGNSLLAFWRHISPRLSRRGRRSMASTPEATRRENKEERNRASNGGKKSKSVDAESKKSVHSSHGDDREWDSVSSGQSRRPNSMITTSSCPSPDSVFVSNTDTAEWIQPLVNKQVMASLEKDRVRDPYQTFKSRSQQQQQQQQQQSECPNTTRPSQLSINSSTPSSSSTARSSSGIKSPTLSSTSTASSGPRYLNVAMSAFGYGYRRQNGSRPASQSTGDGDTSAARREKPEDRLSCPPALPDGVEPPPTDNGNAHTRPGAAGDIHEEEEEEEKEMNGRAASRPNSLSTRTASDDGRTSPTVLRRRAKPTEQPSVAARQTVCGCCHEDTRQPTSGLNCQWRMQRRRRRNLSETTPRGGFTPTSPLNRSFDSQAANRSSLIMLAVGHSSPRPKSLSVSATDESSAPRCCEDMRPSPVKAPSPVGDAAEEVKTLDGRHFLRIVDQAERDIRAQIGVTEADLKEHGDLMCDEVSGILRTAVGKATLLVTDKFAQFRGLCHQNLAAASSNGDHNGETVFATLSSDLEGFWEMVELQVADIRRMFKEIDSLRANSWRRPSVDTDNGTSRPRPSRPAVEQRKKSAQRRPVADASSKASTSAKSNSREEARKRLMAAKREAMARRKAEASVTNSDVIFV